MLFVALLLAFGQVLAQTDPLPSWNEGPARQAIVEFVRVTTDQASPTFVPPAARVATFDCRALHLAPGASPFSASASLSPTSCATTTAM
jgi:hypothetical protein